MAIAYVMHKAPFVFPLVGGRRVEQFVDNLEAINLKLTKEQLTYLDSIVPFDPGFPADTIVRIYFMSMFC